MRLSRIAAVVSVVAVCLGGMTAANAKPQDQDGRDRGWGHRDTELSVGSPSGPFMQNRQNEPAVAINPLQPNLVVGVSNDQIDFEACAAGVPTTCEFSRGVGLSGIEFSLNGGRSFYQPTYTGTSARHCLGPEACVPKTGPIGTFPNYDKRGMATYGDPGVAFGPRPGKDGKFSWKNGSRLYVTGMVQPHVTNPQDWKGLAAIVVSHMDATGPANKLIPALQGKNSAWSDPVVANSQDSDQKFGYKPLIWADNASSSPYFGHVYACGSVARGDAPVQPIEVGTSTDGGKTFTAQEISPPVDESAIGCEIRTDSKGVVYAVWIGESDNSQNGHGWFFQSRSFDGGKTFEAPRKIIEVGGVGGDDPVLGGPTSDGVAGSQTHRLPRIDIANGAPTGKDATNEIVLTWVDNSAGFNQDKAWLAHSTDGGDTYPGKHDVGEPAGRAMFSSVAISPDGEDLYLTYHQMMFPFRTNTSDPRPVRGIVRHSNSFGEAFRTLHRGEWGDMRAASGAPNVKNGFVGDYGYTAATRNGAMTAWNDLRNGQVCAAVQAYRQSLVDGTPIPSPSPTTECPKRYGNTDTYGLAVKDPTRDR